ncbi:uncharacterized protein LOC116175568 isoform X2 [Photinus pyralis]|uniref:uncharacterized protein LOC116175568 isoform X2 n=1 Tax=Photinus pyralis TaxID=7054 RepID=UPI0012674F1B|nr:uncharacterized protein LOC116175568 isoform X2 [Photinus pyralis]
MDASNEAISSDIADSDLSAELPSPVSKSRYGRTRKPKITEDFYDIDVIFEDLNKKIVPRPQPPPSLPKVVKPRQSISHNNKKVNDNKRLKFEHVTADLELEEQVVEVPDSNSKAIHNFFKSESGMSVLHNVDVVPKVDLKCDAEVVQEPLDLESVDVTQVLKIISTKNVDDKLSTDVKANAKPVLKTYSNKRKSYNKLAVMESFGLPDTPIFPVDNDKVSGSEPKRIKSLDVAAPSSENDINLVDKKLLHTPWKIASMDAEIPDLDLLMESTCDDYQEDTMTSPIKILNEVPSMFIESSVEFEPDSTFLGADQIKIPPSPRRSKGGKVNSTSAEGNTQTQSHVEISVPDSSQDCEAVSDKTLSPGIGDNDLSTPKQLKKQPNKVSSKLKMSDDRPKLLSPNLKIREEKPKFLPPGKKSPRRLASTLRLMSTTENVNNIDIASNTPNKVTERKSKCTEMNEDVENIIVASKLRKVNLDEIQLSELSSSIENVRENPKSSEESKKKVVKKQGNCVQGISPDKVKKRTSAKKKKVEDSKDTQTGLDVTAKITRSFGQLSKPFIEEVTNERGRSKSQSTVIGKVTRSSTDEQKRRSKSQPDVKVTGSSTGPNSVVDQNQNPKSKSDAKVTRSSSSTQLPNAIIDLTEDPKPQLDAKVTRPSSGTRVAKLVMQQKEDPKLQLGIKVTRSSSGNRLANPVVERKQNFKPQSDVKATRSSTGPNSAIEEKKSAKSRSSIGANSIIEEKQSVRTESEAKVTRSSTGRPKSAIEEVSPKKQNTKSEFGVTPKVTRSSVQLPKPINEGRQRSKSLSAKVTRASTGDQSLKQPSTDGHDTKPHSDVVVKVTRSSVGQWLMSGTAQELTKKHVGRSSIGDQVPKKASTDQDITVKVTRSLLSNQSLKPMPNSKGEQGNEQAQTKMNSDDSHKSDSSPEPRKLNKSISPRRKVNRVEGQKLRRKLHSPIKRMQPYVLLKSSDFSVLSTNIAKRRRQLLSLVKKGHDKPLLKRKYTTPVATSPVRSLMRRRTHSQPISKRSDGKKTAARRSISSGHVESKTTDCSEAAVEIVEQDVAEVIEVEKYVVVEKRKKGRPRKIVVDTQPVDISREIKQECLDEMDDLEERAKKEKAIGDIMWGKIGGHPYWPCLIVEEPETCVFQKVCPVLSRKALQTMYHVRFFGDRGRRSWVQTTCLLPFASGDDLKRQFTIAKNKANFIVKPSALPKWKIAVTEAESQLQCSVEDRLDFFAKVLEQQAQLLLKIKREDLKSSSPTPSRMASEGDSNSEDDSKSIIDGKLELDSAATISKRRDSKNLSKSSPSPEIETVKKKTKKMLAEVVGEETLKPKPEPDIENESISELKIPWKTIDLSEKNDIHSEYSSDTDTASKSSSNTIIADGFQDEVMRQRRNSLFRGVSRDIVCQVCKQPKEVFKCKGPCRGLYHYKCADFDIKPDVSCGMTVTEELVNKECTPVPSAPAKFSELSIAEQIDIKMKEVMQGMENDTRYADSTTDYSSSEESTCNMLEKADTPQEEEEEVVILHVTADHISVMPRKLLEEATPVQTQIEDTIPKVADVNKNVVESTDEPKVFQCGYCIAKVEPPCFACESDISLKNDSLRQKCSLFSCGKFYHRKCIKLWPQTQWSLISTEKHKKSDKLLDTFICPCHICHTCTSDDPRAATSRSGKKLARCLHCPAAYHTTNYCIPAGTQILSSAQIICPRHFKKHITTKKNAKQVRTINTPWCFICSKGGDLICCETCPTSVHTDCLTINLLDDDTFICEDCESGRFPLYDEIVWVKLGKYRWWPAIILFPNEVPDNVKALPHNSGEFVVKFFGTHDHYWVGRGRVFLFQEGDKGHCSPSKKRMDALFKKSIEEATIVHNIKKNFRKSKVDELKNGAKPPPYIRVKVNKPVGNVRLFDANVSNTTSCECDPFQENPCGPESDCLNRLLLTECDPNICPARKKCNNQRFEKRQYPPLVPYKTEARGWGLKTLAPISKGDFVIEYVGEIIDDQEYQRRVQKMSEQKDENYYFLTIDNNRIIDAGPKGNLARFMNHCCEPNCVTQKWTVNGDTRVGLFAIDNIAADSEVTFNYNLECIGKEKKICRCGASKCSGFIGVKTKTKEEQKAETNDIVQNFSSSQLTTNETDVTSTTCDELDTTECTSETPSDEAQLAASTPVKTPLLVEPLEAHELHTPQSSIPESHDESTPEPVNCQKRKRGRPKKHSLKKKMKLTHSTSKKALNYTAPSLLDVSLQNEVKLTSSIPSRHLRTRSNTKSLGGNRFLEQQNELEKVLPIRKRSRPRCELSL